MIKVIKKNGVVENWDSKKVVKAISLSSHRVNEELSLEDRANFFIKLCSKVNKNGKEVKVYDLHNFVYQTLLEFNEKIAKSYNDFRNYKIDSKNLNDRIAGEISEMLSGSDNKENSNTNFDLISTQKVNASLLLSKDIYKANHLTVKQNQALKDGFIYKHDLSDAIFNMINCCLFDFKTVLKGGFTMSNTFYTEPKNIATAISQVRAIIMCASAQQFGGFTVPEIDSILSKYCELSYVKKTKELRTLFAKVDVRSNNDLECEIHNEAYKFVKDELKNGLKGLEAELNDIVSARGSFPFTTFSFGNDTEFWAKEVSQTLLEVRMEGHGKEGFKKIQIFPKLVFLYEEGVNEDLFNTAIKCSSKSMYPDYLSAIKYKKNGSWVSPMGCVDGDEVITVLRDSKHQTEGIKRLFDNYPSAIKKSGVSEYIDTKDDDFKIYDIDGKFTKVVKFIRNPDFGTRNLIKLSNGRSIIATSDHPFVTLRGRVKVEDLLIGDEIPRTHAFKSSDLSKLSNCIVKEIISLPKIKDNFTYDVETESDTFVVSGLQSHNCRAFLSDYKDSGYVGRFNLGAISLNLPMIFQKSITEETYFYNELEYYLDMIRDMHKYHYSQMSKQKASSNPLGFCEGGFLGGHLKPSDTIESVLQYSTSSFGVTALNELTELWCKEGIKDYDLFAKEVVDFINDYIDKAKEEDSINYALYGTPAESLSGTQANQFNKKYPETVLKDRKYFTNSFHCHVSSEITPFVKQDKEETLFHKVNGGHIQYVRITDTSNLEGLKAIVKRGMSKGFYQGVNFEKCACEDCGFQDNYMKETCPSCGSNNITQFDRICGYLGYSKRKGSGTINSAMISNINDRKSM